MNDPIAAVIIIGDEILSGRTRYTNANFIAARLHQRGIALKRIITVPDEMDVIVGTVSKPILCRNRNKKMFLSFRLNRCLHYCSWTYDLELGLLHTFRQLLLLPV